MSEVLTIPDMRQQATSQVFACRLRKKSVIGRHGPVPYMAEFELQNVSTATLEIAYRMTALQFLNLVVAKEDGSVVSEGHFGDRFAPTLEPQILRLEPGEVFTANVHLFATVRSDPVPAGTYTVQAVYEYHADRTVSDPLAITVGGT